MSSSASSVICSGWMALTANTPLVSVPVLSKTTVSTPASVSRSLAPLIRMPSREAPPIPPKKVSGTEMTSAHGQEMTRKISARSIQTFHAPSPASGGSSASSSAPKTTQGV